MAAFSLEGKIFEAVSNSTNGDVTDETLFYYHHKDDYIWGHYGGGPIVAGVLIGKVLPDNRLEFEYSHFDQDGNYRAGKCSSQVVVDKNGLLKLLENWQWTTGDKSKGTSILIEKRTD